MTMRNTTVVSQHAFWKNAILGGLIGGAVFVIAEMLMVVLIDESPFAPPRMIAAMLLGPDVLPPPADFDIGILMAAMVIHLPLSALYGVIFAAIVRRMDHARALLTGAVLGLAIYLINFYGIASFIFEWFAMARNWVSLTTHVLFGLATVWAYLTLARAAP